MQGVTLVAETFCDGGDARVVLEELTYNGTIDAYRSLGIEMVGVPVDGSGMRIDRLAATLDEMARDGRPPRFIYTLATYQNPTGAMMPRARRAELLACAKRHGCLVVEDNCYGDVHYDGEKPPALYAMDDYPEQIYICSLSKNLRPGVRLGYLVARPPLLDRLLARRHDAGPNTLSAAITTEYLGPDLWGHVERANAALKVKRDTMLAALETHLGNWCSWSRPVGGCSSGCGFRTVSTPESSPPPRPPGGSRTSPVPTTTSRVQRCPSSASRSAFRTSTRSRPASPASARASARQ